MMLSHPVLLGFVWSLLVLSTSGQSQISNTESNKVYAYSYHFQHNGNTNSTEILRNVLGADPEFDLSPEVGKSIVKTFTSPGIRGFFTKGILPAGPISRSFSNRFSSPYADIRKIVEANLQPPANVATGLLPPISPDIPRNFPGDFNANHVRNILPNQDDFPKIPPPQAFPNNNGHRNVESFSRDTPDGGKIVGQVETFAYNPPPITNSISRIEENSQGYRRNENILNNNREVTGHRTQTYFRQNFRTVTPNLESHDFNQFNRIDSRNSGTHSNSNNNNNNQWWNGLNMLGNVDSNIKPPVPDINSHIDRNINEIKNNINRAFGARLTGFNRQNNPTPLINDRRNDYENQNRGSMFNPNPTFNHLPPIQTNNPLQNNVPIVNVPFNQAQGQNDRQNIVNNNGYLNIPNPAFNVNNNFPNVNPNGNYRAPNRGVPGNVQNRNNINDKETEKKVLNLIQNARSHLNNLHENNQDINNIGPIWDDDISRNINSDWSSRQPNLNRRPFSNGHSGPSNIPPSVDSVRRTVESLIGNRNFNNPGNHGNSYRNADGGGVEKVYGIDKVMEGPNSYSRNQQRGYERDFRVNSNSGYNRSNQWSTNNVRRLDAQSSKPDFSRDFIDVFRDDK